jgi:phosphatidylserine/phosphatidylglycerophosphate/cardiolipin synthase-like enzyme
MTAALRSLYESLAGSGEPGLVFASVRRTLAARTTGPIGPDDLRGALVAVGVRASAHQISIDLRSLGVLHEGGDVDDRRAQDVEAALGLVAGSFEAPHQRETWRLVATVPERHWGVGGMPAVRQTAGVVLGIVDQARHHLRVAMPFVDTAASGWLEEPLVRAWRRGAALTISTSPGHASRFARLADTCARDPGPLVRVVEVEAEASPLGSHAKVVSADGERAYLGSANLTAAGFARQFELGAEVTGPQVSQIDLILAAVDRLGVVRHEVAG